MLLIMRELFYLNSLWKVKALMKEEVFDEKKRCSLKIKVSKVLLCFKDKESDEKMLVFGKEKVYDESTSLC